MVSVRPVPRRRPLAAFQRLRVNLRGHLTHLHWIGRGLLLFTLFLPSLLGTVDHHGAERIPTHSHVALEGEPVATEPALLHTHGFERDHPHDGHALVPNGGLVALALSTVATLLSAGPITVQSAVDLLPAAILALALCSALKCRYSGSIAEVRLPSGVFAAPSLPPPRAALPS